MDRFKEFLAIVERTGIEQNPVGDSSFYLNIRDAEVKIDKILDQLSRLTIYESFIANSLLSQCGELLKDYRSIPINANVSRDYIEVVENLKSMVKTKYLKYVLKLNELSRKYTKDRHVKSAVVNTNDTSAAPVHTGRSGDDEAIQKQKMYFQKPTDHLAEDKKEDCVEERRRIVNSITEIGQIVEDISIHVNLQEEQLKRIDDVLIKSNRWTRKAVDELNDIWDIMKSNRHTMIRFFVFWVLVVLLFWFLRRI